MNFDFLNVEVLVAQQDPLNNNCYDVISVSYGNQLASDARYKIFRASLLAIDMVKAALKAGKIVKVPAQINGPEVCPCDIIVSDAGDELTVAKRVLINEMNSAITQNAVGVSVIDTFGFISAFSRLADHGVFITDENREEKYFEVIDKAQQTEKPDELPENASYADEQAYLEKKKKYAFAQSTLESLEQYLVSYDKIKAIYFFDKKLRELVAEAEAAQNQEDLQPIREKFGKLVNRMFTAG